jgi:YidC/Oxa1 family membrane protein insertase
MLAVFNPFVDLAYHVVSVLAAGLAPLPAGLAAAAAIVVFTMAVRLAVLPLSYYAMRGQHAQARLAAQVQELRQRYARQPDRLRTEITAMYQREGAGMLSGCLPVLLQAPFLSVMYLVFRSPTVAGKANALLTHNLFGAPLGSHWLGGAGPISTQGAVFAGIFVLLALVGWLHARMLASAMPPPAVGTPAVGTAVGTPAVGTALGTPALGTAVGTPAGGPGRRQPTAQPPGAVLVLTRLAPYVTVVLAAFVPLAAGLYLVTTTAWTLAERKVMLRRIHRPPTAPGTASGGRAGTS